MLLRNLHLHIRDALSHKMRVLSGAELPNKTIGIIGYGKIGQAIGKKLQGFEVNILFYDNSVSDSKCDYGIKQVRSLEIILKNSDIIILACSLTDKTRHILNSEKFNMLNKGTLLINIARGALVDTNSLIAALDDGILHGVALDVLEEEQEILANPNHELWNRLINRYEVIFTPHNGFFTEESLARLWYSLKEIV